MADKWIKAAVAVREGRAPRIAVARASAWGRRFLWEPLDHRLGKPTLAEMLGTNGHLCVSASELLEHLYSGADVRPIAAEFDELKGRLITRKAEQIVYGDIFGVEWETAFALYGIVRLGTPQHILETGVADGVSSSVMLNALMLNGSGTLHSIDIRTNVGILVRPEERVHWDLRMLDRTRPRDSFRELVSTLPLLDAFIHDSMHTYSWQSFELSTAAEHLRVGALLASDDVDASYAFAHSCESRGLDPYLLVDRRKFFGIAVVT